MGLVELFHMRENNLLSEPMIHLQPPPLATEDSSLNTNIWVWYAFLSQSSSQKYYPLMNLPFKQTPNNYREHLAENNE